MIWEFGEIGYDLSINYPSGTDDDRTSEKPVKTDEYMKVPERKALYDTYVGLIKFRRDNPRFFDADAKFDWDPDSEVKTIMCTVDSKRFHVVGNFAKEIRSYSVPAGQWKDYFNKWRIIKRFVKQKLRLEKSNYKPSIEMFKLMFKWTNEFEKNKNEFELMLDRYTGKLIKLNNKTEIKRYLKM